MNMLFSQDRDAGVWSRDDPEILDVPKEMRQITLTCLSALRLKLHYI